MKSLSTLLALSVMSGAILVGCGETAGVLDDGASKPTTPTSQTAQSIGITFNNVPTAIVVEDDGETVWTFDRSCAQGFYQVTGTTGSPNAGQTNSAFQHLANLNAVQCTFFNGGTLVAHTFTVSSGKTVTLSPKNTTAFPATVPAGQCWTSETTGGSGVIDVDFDLQADIAGESLNLKSSGPWGKKFSFSLLDSAGYTRVNNVTYYFESYDGTSWNEIDSYAVGDVTDVEEGTFSHYYEANGGTFGNVISHLVDGYTMGEIMDNTYGSGDDFTGNNSTTSGSGSNAMVAHGPAYTFNVSAAGTYRVRVTGTVKGNDGSAARGFTASTSGTSVVIGAPDCD